jgi:glycosyltransferase involved in cell wall biosynthesis
MKKIVIVTSGNVVQGSWGLRIRMWVKSFLLNGVEPKVLVSYPNPTHDQMDIALDEFEYSLAPKEIYGGTLNKFHYSLQKISGTLVSLYRLSRMDNVDVVLIHQADFFLGINLIVLRKFKKFKLYCERADENGKIHDISKSSLVSKIASLNQELFEKLVLKHCDKLFVVSSYLYNKYASKLPNVTIRYTVPTYVDEKEFIKNSKNYNFTDLNISELDDLGTDKIKIVYAGAVNRLNGIEFFFKALKDLIDTSELKPLVVYFFCLYGDKDKLIQLADNYHLGTFVKVLDALPQRYLPSIYLKSDILLLPEHGEVIANAGFPGKTGEYLVSGTPVITKEFSDLGKYLTNGVTAMISSINDLGSYKQNLKHLIQDQKHRYRIGQNGRNLALEKFDVSKGVIPYLCD